MNIKPWGQHLILTARRCNPTAIRCKNTIDLFSRKLVKRINMVPFGEPRIVHFGEGNKAGYTLVQLIETSNIVGHFVEEYDDLHLDVFSCKDFFAKDVEEEVYRSFFPKEITYQTVLR